MAMPPSGTFEYVATVPDHAEGRPFKCRCRSLTTGFPGHRLVGANPVAHFKPVGLTPNAGPDRPAVMCARVTLRGRLFERKTVRATSFTVDQSLADRLQAGDVVHFARTASGGLAMSALRGSELVYAVGAVTSVPLGHQITIGSPVETILAAEGLFRQLDEEFEFRDYPLQISLGGARWVTYGGRRKIGDYHVYVKHGHRAGLPGVDACVAVARDGWCPPEAANASAMLLAGATANFDS